MDNNTPPLSPFWHLLVAGDEDENAADSLPPSAANAFTDQEYMPEFFGSLPPFGGANLLPDSVACSVVYGDGGECSRHVEKGGAGDFACVDAAPDCANGGEEGEKNYLPCTRKRHRSSEAHNLNERKRRDRLSERMRTLQSLIPNSHKLDRAALLDKAIEYLKSLQQQLQIMSDGSQRPPQLMPPAAVHCPPLPHHSLFAAMNLSMNTGYGMGMPSLASPMMSPASSSLPAISYLPLPTPSSISRFQTPMAMHFWPYNVPQEFPMPVAAAVAASSRTSQVQAELPPSVSEAKTGNAMAQKPDFSGPCS